VVDQPRLGLESIEQVFYTDRVLPLEARILVAKIRRTVQERMPWRPLITADGRAVLELVPSGAGGVNLLALEAGSPSGSRDPGQGQTGPHVSSMQAKAVSNQKAFQLRRGEDQERSSCEILTPMASPSLASDADSDASAASPSGISAFIARVLAQLTLSAWLPAAFLTASGAILLQFRSTRSANLLNAVRELTADPVQVLVIIIPLLVIAAVVTQAFSFQAIRALEGYWPGRGPVSFARTLMIRRHIHRKKAITKRRLAEAEKALLTAMPAMLMSGIPFPVVKALEAYLSGKEPPQLTSEEREVAVGTEWRSWCDAWRLAKVDHLLNEEEGYPDTFRVLSTKLGNLLRATEDQLTHTDDDLQGYALRRYEMVPRQVQIQHDVYRTRLEMYCTLVFVSGSLMLFTLLALLGRVNIIAVAVTFASFAVMSVVSYLAALTSADGYCFALRQMDESFPASAET
jgi:hypothetical protein